ncbi:PREDICTED: deSI-like protein At4g17486 [Tarenaya hassleriana]|uniref:deSI-like protein At4g17486 n=1 Tax=Tarenaya hassleriana TaxID=28532 RepID=UPI00053C0E88|nr:PREDICTED: deSI-like protein At4g17486 [Tarenaya hassleriana]
MVDEKSSDSSFGNGEEDLGDVVLNVYDLTPINNYTYLFGLGIFHSGIEVHGKEYGFGAHEFPVSGVFEVDPRSCPGFIYRCSVSLGRTKMSPSEFRVFIETTASEYHGDTYHLITKNCNHFTDDIAWRLTGKHVPGWVNRLARLGALCSCLLPESLQVTTVKQLPEYHEVAEEGSESHSTATPQDFEEISDGDQEKQLLSPVDVAGEVSFIRETYK